MGKRGDKTIAADYIITGQWGDKAVAECQKYGKVNIAVTTKPTKFTSIPAESEWKLSPDALYVHYTDNETVNGVEFKSVPDAKGKLLVADVSSNFMSRPIDFSKHAVGYAGAQKNAGPSGTTVVFVRDDVLGSPLPECPTAMDLKAQGGVEHYAKLAAQRSAMLYETIDGSNGFYKAAVEPASRSRLNAPFVIKGDDPDLTKKFLAAAESEGLTALAGHKSVGGCRASMYNALPVEGVARLCEFMKRFQAANA